MHTVARSLGVKPVFEEQLPENDITLSDADAREEVVSDYIGSLIYDKEHMGKVADKLSHPILSKIRDVVSDFLDYFRRNKMTADERLAKGSLRAIDRALARASNSVRNEVGTTKFSLGDTPESFKNRQKRAVENRGTVMPGLNEVEVKVVNVPRHNYAGRWSDAKKLSINDAVNKYTRIIKDENGKEKRIPIPQAYNNFGNSFAYIISKNSIEESVNPKQIDKSVSQGAPHGVHLSILNHLDEVINNSIEVEEHPDYQKNGNGIRTTDNINNESLMHRFYGCVTVDGIPYRVMTLMREDTTKNNKNGAYAYSVQKIEVLNEKSPSTSNGLDDTKNNLTYPLTKLLNGVEKSYDKGKKLLDESKNNAISAGGDKYSLRKGGKEYRNNGYTQREDGTNISVRAQDAEEEGTFSKGNFAKHYGVSKNDFEVLNELGIIKNTEWHHTGVNFGKTDFYSWKDSERADGDVYYGEFDELPDNSFSSIYKANKSEISNLVKEFNSKAWTNVPKAENDAESLVYFYSNDAKGKPLMKLMQMFGYSQEEASRRIYSAHINYLQQSQMDRADKASNEVKIVYDAKIALENGALDKWINKAVKDGKATFVERVLTKPENFVETKVEMKGRYGWYVPTYRHTGTKYYSGYSFSTKRMLDSYNKRAQSVANLKRERAIESNRAFDAVMSEKFSFREDNAEMDEIVAKAKANGTYMKAPNGKQSKLNPRQWAQVRSKAFKQWFGDWELSSKVLNVVNGSMEHGLKNFDDAREWAKENIVRTLTNEETGGKGEIRISNNAVAKFLSESAVAKSESKDVHLSVLKVLPDVIRESVDAEQHPDYKKGADGKRSAENGVNENVTIHRLYGAVDIDGKTYRVKVTLKEYADINRPRKAYSYEATKIELLAGTLVGGQASNPSTNNSISAANLLENVENSKGNGKKLLDCSKVVDENGEPMVVYHQTANKFTVFNTNNEKAGKYDSVTPIGMFFKSNDKNIMVEGNIQMPCYINTENLKTFTDRNELRSYWMKNVDGYSELQQKSDSIEQKYKPRIEELESEGDRLYESHYKEIVDGVLPKHIREQMDNLDKQIDELLSTWNKESNEINRKQKELITKYSSKSGIDGIRIKNDYGVDTYIVFNPTQIKSATDNVGTFDANNPDIRYSLREDARLRDEQRKEEQLRIINQTNPAPDDYHTWIRSTKDILTLKEAVDEVLKEDPEYELSAYPDVSDAVIREALETGEITVYSSYPIENGVFVSPSKMQAKDYAGGGKVYSKVVPINDVAWITPDEGQMASVEEKIPVVKYQIIGEKGAEALDKAQEASIRMDNLSVAREMEKAGKDAKTIRLATGWERGADGKWRYEIMDGKFDRKGELHPERYELSSDDKKFLQDIFKEELEAFNKGVEVYKGKINNDADMVELYVAGGLERSKAERLMQIDAKKRKLDEYKKKKKLDDYLDNDEIFKAYPKLRYVNVYLGDGNIALSGKLGSYKPEQNEIELYDISMDTLLHEVQHAIQHIEGFAKGGSKNEINKLFNDAYSELKARRWAEDLMRTAKEHEGEYQSQIEIEDILEKDYHDEDLSELIPSRKIREKGFNYFVRGYYDSALDDAIKQFKLDSNGGVNFDSYKGYKGISGEVEARNVEARMNMSERERRETLLADTEDVARKDQIFLFNNLSESQMGSRVYKRMAEVGEYFEGRKLSDNERAVVDVFSGKSDNKAITVERDGKQHKVVMRQGNENKAGTKHSLFRHYGTNSGVISSEDLLLIPEVIERGEKETKGNGIAYKLKKDGVVYTVYNEIQNGQERFCDFYTNKKGGSTSLFNTQLSAQDYDATTSNGANLVKENETASGVENFSLREDAVSLKSILNDRNIGLKEQITLSKALLAEQNKSDFSSRSGLYYRVSGM